MSFGENEQFRNDLSKIVELLVHFDSDDARSQHYIEEDEELEENHEEEMENQDVQPDPEQENVHQLRDRSLVRRPDYYGLVVSYYSSIESVSDKEAIQEENPAEWTKAMKEEFIALKENNTCTLESPPKDCRVIDNKWVFKIKTDSDGNPVRFKARSVARGC